MKEEDCALVKLKIFDFMQYIYMKSNTIAIPLLFKPLQLYRVSHRNELYWGYIMKIQGFTSKKDARFSKLKNFHDLFNDGRAGKITKNINFEYFSNQAILRETLYKAFL